MDYELKIKQIAMHYGKESQTIVAIEELSELQKELTKALRGKGSYVHITEEIADVMVMINQLRILYGISDSELMKVFDEKVERTLERMKYDDGGII